MILRQCTLSSTYRRQTRLRIALVITELDPGGAEQCLTELALYLARLGHTVKVWSIGPAPTAGRDGLVMRLTSASIDVQFASARGSLDGIRIVRWLRRELKEFRPDIVQSMLWHANMMTAGALWSNKIPWVAGMRVSEPRSGRWWLERLASRRMDRLVCVSRDVYEHALHRERIAADKLLIIPNGVAECWLDESLPKGEWSQLGHPPPSHSLLFVGRLESQKGVLPLVEHIPEILAGRDDWAMIMMGHGSLKASLSSRVQSLGLEPRVHIVGWQPEAPRWMKAADVFVLPAEYEGMPNVILEAMAIGRPFVAFAVDGVSQLIDARDGYSAELAAMQLAPPGNWPEFVRLLRLQMDNANLREQCGRANREHVAQHFRLEDQLARYLALYESLV